MRLFGQDFSVGQVVSLGLLAFLVLFLMGYLVSLRSGGSGLGDHYVCFYKVDSFVFDNHPVWTCFVNENSSLKTVCYNSTCYSCVYYGRGLVSPGEVKS